MQTATKPASTDKRTAEPRSRDDWVKATIAALQEQSVESLRIDEIADSLSVTKGSFYHHFDSRGELLEAVLDYWRQSMTDEVEAFILASVGTPLGRLNRLIKIAIAPRNNVPGGPLEIRLREWAHREPAVLKVVQEVDACRLRFLTGLYMELGLDGDRAREYADLHLAFAIGARIMLDGKDREDYEAQITIGQKFLVPADDRP